MSLNNTSGNDDSALVPRPSSAVGKAEPGAERILSGMVADTLALANREQLKPAKARFRIGDYEWCEPDYRQILMWAKALNLTPEAVQERLFTELKHPYFTGEVRAEHTTQCVNGRIIRLGWDIGLLPLECFEWVAGLVIESIAFFVPSEIHESQRTGRNLPLPLPELRYLDCNWLALTKLDLSAVPLLSELCCDTNELTELDLSAVPLLTRLSCGANELTELDLSAVPLLTRLDCGFNQLTQLDLSVVPLLTDLSCSCNQLTELDLSAVPLLTELWCNSSQLTELDLSAVPLLTLLHCFSSQLTELDLSAVPLLTRLDCGFNQLTELDLSFVPLLTWLWCAQNHLTELDIRPLEHLKNLHHDADKTRLIQRPDQNF